MTMLSPVSETYWNIQGQVIFWVLFFIAFVLFVKRVYSLLRLLHLGKEENRFDRTGHRIKSPLIDVLLGWCTLKYVTRKDITGIGHAFMVWGGGLFTIGYIIFIGFGGGFGMSEMFASGKFEKVFFSVLDIAGLFVITGLILATFKRYIVKPARLEESTREGGIVLPLIFVAMFALIMFHYCMEGFGYSSSKNIGSWPPVGAAVATFIASTGISEGILVGFYKGFWWLNYTIILGFIVYVPHSRHLHPLFSPANIFFRSTERNKGILKPVRFRQAKTLGIQKIRDFTWKQLLDLYACTDCGRCQENCPAFLAQKPLSPWKVIKDLRNHLLSLPDKTESETLELVENVIKSEEIWSCTTCLACQEVCPVAIEHVDKLINLRRSQVDQGECPPLCVTALEGIANRGNPWALAPTDRINWAENLKSNILRTTDKAEWLYWVGCSSSSEPVAQDISKAVITLLDQAGINYTLLGTKEKCCGDPARRIGEEGLFQKICQENITTFSSYKVQKIITHCPHCYNMFKNEYPLMGGDYKVYHHTQLFSQLLEEKKLTPVRELKLNAVFYQDPCYLGRYNRLFEEARHIIQTLPSAHLLNPTGGDKAVCCGGGGGEVWLDIRKGERIENVRLAQIERFYPEILAVACPFCKIMLDSAAASRGTLNQQKVVRVRDVSELLLEAV